MALSYDFNQFINRYAHEPNDRRRLNIQRTAQNIIDLRTALNNEGGPHYVPQKTESALLLATWNIMHFGSTDRYDESLWYIAEIISRFDLVAIQEVKQSLRDLQVVCDLLGQWWNYLVSDVTVGTPGNQERLAYLYDTRKVDFSGLAGEIVLPPIEDAHGNEINPRQLVRTPYLAGFQAGWFDFIISTVHLLWGENIPDFAPRVDEITQLTEFLVNRRAETGAWSRNMILLGDFNIFDEDGVAARALTNSGFQIPHGREDLPRTNVGQAGRFYDQIAFYLDHEIQLNPLAFGVIDFFDEIYSDAKFADYQHELRTSSDALPSNAWSYYRNTWRRREMSDHLVLWIQLPTDFSMDCLRVVTG